MKDETLQAAGVGGAAFLLAGFAMLLLGPFFKSWHAIVSGCAFMWFGLRFIRQVEKSYRKDFKALARTGGEK